MGTIRAFLQLLFIPLLVSASFAAPRQASAEEENKSNWGNTPGLRPAHPDSRGRSGHWWWPETSAQQDNVPAGKGNGGRVFGSIPGLPSQSEDFSGDLTRPSVVEPLTTICTAIVLNNILFTSDSVALRPEGAAEADKLILEMKKFGKDTLVCVGHTDDMGDAEYNQKLGLRRAQAVVDYMAANGIARERLRAESKGETEPAAPNNTPANRALNRRVVFEIRYGD